MEQIETIQKIRNIHKFYCDDCNKFLIESEELDDFYVEEPREFRIQHVKLKGHFCELCGNARVEKVVDYARSMGFDI